MGRGGGVVTYVTIGCLEGRRWENCFACELLSCKIEVDDPVAKQLCTTSRDCGIARWRV